MSRRELQKQQTYDRYLKLYKRINKLGMETPVKTICQRLDISESTYYRVLNRCKDTPVKIKKQHENIDELAGIVESKPVVTDESTISDNYDCPLEDCPTNTNIKFGPSSKHFTHMMQEHSCDFGKLCLVNESSDDIRTTEQAEDSRFKDSCN